MYLIFISYENFGYTGVERDLKVERAKYLWGSEGGARDACVRMR